MKHFTELRAWHTGIELVKEIYALTKKFPKEEMFGMTSQVRRSSTSILANLAEGFSRFAYADRAHKYIISRGECSETEAFLHIAISLDFLSASDCQNAMQLVENERKMISGLVAACKNPDSVSHSGYSDSGSRK